MQQSLAVDLEFDVGKPPFTITAAACPISWLAAGDTFATAPPTNPACAGAQRTIVLSPYGVSNHCYVPDLSADAELVDGLRK